MARDALSGINLEGPLFLGGNPGTPGQSPQSAGPGVAPVWGTPGVGGATLETVNLDFGDIVYAKTFVFAVPVALGRPVLMAASASNGDELEFDGFTCAAQVTALNEVTAVITANPGPVSGTRDFDLLIF